jgi:hypothetical protein
MTQARVSGVVRDDVRSRDMALNEREIATLFGRATRTLDFPIASPCRNRNVSTRAEVLAGTASGGLIRP